MHLPKFELPKWLAIQRTFLYAITKRNIVFTKLIVKNLEYLNDNHVFNKHKFLHRMIIQNPFKSQTQNSHTESTQRFPQEQTRPLHIAFLQ